ncbi:tetratricopeptide repeat protein [Jiella avicenniae]|uniref:Tetratricopeptide repeat protein n=1 Tax=Jiella avicenniae TaxID=2907202 RepID=A0A9X1TB51_9HYPH|nr:glycosyltransferase [Jiella avicenniae]MCE7027793.1 tetratricopeptide repeat protein [Jiella avicenniae]
MSAAGTRFRTNPVRWLAARGRSTPHVLRADKLRDAGNPAAAARAYEAALKVDPGRTNLKVQCGNMHKDAGAIDAALHWYESALADRPDDADIHLQAGHALKLAGRRTEALAAYRRVLALDPANRNASWELVQAGDEGEQMRGIAAQMTGHGLETMLSLSAEVAAMRRKLDEIAAALPDVASLAAFPAKAYRHFREIFDVPSPASLERPADLPHLTVVADAAGLDAAALHRLLASVVGQSAMRWRAVLFDVEPSLLVAVERLARADDRLEAAPAASEGAGGTAVLDLVQETGTDAVLFLPRSAAMHRHCLAWLAAAFAGSAADVLTFDEEWVVPGETEPSSFEARGGLDPEMLLQENGWGEAIAVRKTTLGAFDLARREGRRLPEPSDLLLSALRAGASFGHTPYPLVVYEGDGNARDAVRRKALAEHRQAVERHLRLCDLGRQVILSEGADGGPLHLEWRAGSPHAAITVIVPTRDNAEDCAVFVDSLFVKASDPDGLQILIVDNATTARSDLVGLDALAARKGVRVSRDDGPFNWSHINNLAAATSDTPILVFANDDMRMLSSGWDERLRGLLARENVGAVGAKLLYPDETVQHAGVLFGWKGSVIHDGLFEARDAAGPSGRWIKTRRASAVTGAFMAVRRDDFLALGGFDAAGLPIGYSDIDLCLRLHASGRDILWTPDVTLLHYESKSRGLDHLDTERAERSRRERALIESRWGAEVFSRDPTISPIWIDATLPYRLISFPAPQRALDFVRLTSRASRAETESARSTAACE